MFQVVMDSMFHLYNAYKNIMNLTSDQVGGRTTMSRPESGVREDALESGLEELNPRSLQRLHQVLQVQQWEEKEEEESRHNDNSLDEVGDNEEEVEQQQCGARVSEPPSPVEEDQGAGAAAVAEAESSGTSPVSDPSWETVKVCQDVLFPEPCAPTLAMKTDKTNTASLRELQSSVSYESVQLPGSIMDETRVLTSADALQAKYERYNDPFMIRKDTDDRQVRKTVETLFFRDNKRRIDYVLVYREEDDPAKVEMRKAFEENLLEKGLELETEDKNQSQDGETYFVKIHAPWDLLVRYAEIMNLKKPIKKFIVIRGGEVWKDDMEKKKRGFFSWLGMKDPFQYNEDVIPQEPTYFTTGFTRSMTEQSHLEDIPCFRLVYTPSGSKGELTGFHKTLAEKGFIIKDRESFFTPSQRSQIVWEILLRVHYSDAELDTFKLRSVGVSRLLSTSTYEAAFPLHDGRHDKDGPDGSLCDRRLLFLEWAYYGNWYKKQPLHVIRRYFGDKMALYFAWLGFYTEMLIPASILGAFTFLCGLFIMYSDFNKPSEEICTNKTDSLIMCPLCDKLCDFWKLEDSCLNSRITFLFDNPATVFFSIAMSFWATMFLELWKRKQAVIQWQWDLDNYEEEEELRPEFEEKVTTTRINPVTNKPEPYLPLLNQITRLVAANSLVLLMLFVVMAAVFSVILYRMAVIIAMYQTTSDLFRRNAKLVTSMTAACLNLMVIIILNFFYEKLVVWLTNLEVPRTETEYEDSFTLKMFLFQFINFYSSLIYIAFFKGRFFYHPGDADARTNLLMKLRYDMCDPAGCLFELCVQLAIIMVGKQIFSNVLEIIFPIMRVWWNKRTGHDNQMSEAYTRWEQDYDLAPYTRLSLFNEYLEMVIQYGFVTLFVAAFPLAPIFALLNNIVEIRLDAYKYLTKCRRPRSERIQDIGIWFGILKGITYFSVFTNALVISYTSDFIPRLVYMYGYSPGRNTLEGYIENTLSVFNTSEYTDEMGPENRTGWPETCRYRAYRNGPNDENPYGFNQQFWHVFTARLAFILIFEHVVFLLTGAVAMAIPDVPVEVKNQMMREKKVEKETLFKNEMQKMQHERHVRQVLSPDDHLNIDLGEGLITRASSRNNSPTPSAFLRDHRS
ncbi:anoctamin-4-like isoform X1 [Homarus americanus]|uniref:anoctamin-4-like isoform X1 n=1 Tax=Homarus americanus TaxID=6706 RepID=UPI001C490CC4|nr:anoctamin-4-like isoform X1 [Homarus americanus]